MALRLYHSGAVPTKKDAALAAGLPPQTLYTVSSPIVADAQVKQLVTHVDQMVEDATVSTREIRERLARLALGKLGNLMNGAESERVQLDAAKDLADRGQETSKVQKMQVESWTLGDADAKLLAAAMVQAARVEQANRALEVQDFIKLEGGLDAKVRIEDEAGTALEGTAQAVSDTAEGQDQAQSVQE